MVPTDLNRLVDDTLQLYGGVLQQGRCGSSGSWRPCLPPVRLDAEQMRQVIINLVDNAMEALGGPRRRHGRTARCRRFSRARPRTIARNGVVRLVVSDNGPGVPPADRDKLFMPYYSTKGRGSGLGLAIVRRIVVEHGGGIEVGDAPAVRARSFTVELPAA